MDRLPLVTVVLPAYNYERYVTDAVESVFAQTYAPLELVAVDDGSTDSTVHILEAMRTAAPIPMSIVRAEHRGVAAAMNTGLSRAAGTFVSVLHADDIYERTKVAEQVAVFMDQPDVVLVHSEYCAIDANGELIDGLDSSLDLPPAEGVSLRNILAGDADVRSMTMMYRRATLLSLGGYDEALPSEDWQSILRLAKAGSIGHVAKPLVRRRVHRQNYSVRLYTSKTFDIGETAANVLREVTPADMDLQAIGGNAVGTVVRNSLAEGNIGKAIEGLRSGWNEFPGGRQQMLRRASGGFRSFVWVSYGQRLLPQKAVGHLRARKARRRLARGG